MTHQLKTWKGEFGNSYTDRNVIDWRVCLPILRRMTEGLPLQRVLEAGFLIHIPLLDLPKALTEVCRVSRRYVLAVEYFSEDETAIVYKGRENLLWKRNFLRHYRDQCLEWALIRNGYWGPEDGFDRVHCWLLEREPAG